MPAAQSPAYDPDSTPGGQIAPGPQTIQQEPGRPIGRPDWLPFALYWALALLFTWPLPTKAATAIMGDGKDGWLETWNLWWLSRAISTGAPPYHFTTVFAPDGVTNYLHALHPLEGLLTLPLQWLFGAPFAYNAACWAALALTAFGCYLLCRDMSGSRPAGFVGGLAFGFAPRQFAQLLDHMSVGSVEFYAFGVWCLYRGVHEQGRRSFIWALWSAACLVASIFSHLYTALFQAITLAVLGGLWSVLRVGGSRGRPLIATATALFLGLLVCAPFLVAVAGSARGADAPGQQEGTTVEIGQYSADLAAFAIPNPFHPAWGAPSRDALRSLQGTLIEKVTFPGYVVYALALMAIVAPGSRRKALPWVALALTGFVLSLGPTLHVGGQDTGFPMPGAIFYALPLSSLARVPARFGLITELGLSVCASLGVLSLLRLPIGVRWRRVPAYVVLAVLVVELLPMPYPTSNWQVDLWYTRTTLVEEGRSAVLEVPFDQYDTRPLASQIASGMPLAGGYLSRMPVYPLSRGVPPFTDFGLNRVPGTPLRDPGEQWLCQPGPGQADSLDMMRLAGTRYLALHLDRLRPDDSRIALAERLFPAGPVYSDEVLQVYDTGGGDPPASLFGAVEDTVDWGPVEEGTYRWTGSPVARIHAWSGADRVTNATLTLAAFAHPRKVRFTSGSQLLAEGQIEQAGTKFAFDWTLSRGFNTLVISTEGAAVSPASLGMGDDPRPLAFSLSGCVFRTR